MSERATSEELIQRSHDAGNADQFCRSMLALRDRLREIMNAWERVRGHPAVMVEDPDEFEPLRRAIEGAK